MGGGTAEEGGERGYDLLTVNGLLENSIEKEKKGNILKTGERKSKQTNKQR